MREELVAITAILKRLAEIDKTLVIHDVPLREIPEKLCPRLRLTGSLFRIFPRIFPCFRALEAYSFCCLNSACADVL